MTSRRAAREPDVEALLEQLAALQPWMVRRYLEAQGWRLVSDAPPGQMWSAPGQPKRSLFLPLDPGLRDFAERMGDAVHLLAATEGRSESDLIATLSPSVADSFSIRLMPDAPMGTIPLRLGARAHETVRELLLCAAYEALVPDTPRVQMGPRPRLVRHVVDRALLARSEAAGYVITVRLPLDRLDVAAHMEQSLLRPVEEEAALGAERDVARALARGVTAAAAAAESAFEGGGLSAFADQAGKGLSADLCAALARLGGEAGLPFEIAFMWALRRPYDAPAGPVAFPGHYASVLEEGAKYLREAHSRPDTPLRGTIIALHRETQDGPGEATVVTVVDDYDTDAPRQRRVRLHLDAPDYERAIEAHRAHDEVSARGVLRRRGKHLHLDDIRDFDAYDPVD
ncbi:hypothetical protein OG216_03140 [Streptomycetaceae bacterium NBC_01309]